jgi:hypothetical protein
MLPPPQGRRQEDRFSVSGIPHQNLRTVVQSPCLRILFQESDQFGRIPNDNPDDAAIRGDATRNQETAMAEVRDFLEHQERDIYWNSPRTKHEVSVQWRFTIPKIYVGALTRVQVLLSHEPLDSSLIHAIKDLPETEAFGTFVEFVALQLLASCYTLLPASSADNLPLGQQRIGSRVITA